MLPETVQCVAAAMAGRDEGTAGAAAVFVNVYRGVFADRQYFRARNTLLASLNVYSVHYDATTGVAAAAAAAEKGQPKWLQYVWSLLSLTQILCDVARTFVLRLMICFGMIACVGGAPRGGANSLQSAALCSGLRGADGYRRAPRRVNDTDDLMPS